MHRVHIEPREPIAAIGSGDAFLAGYVAARYGGRHAGGLPALRRRLRRGVDEPPRRGLIDPREVERLLPDVTVREVQLPAEVG